MALLLFVPAGRRAHLYPVNVLKAKLLQVVWSNKKVKRKFFHISIVTGLVNDLVKTCVRSERFGENVRKKVKRSEEKVKSFTIPS